MALAAILAVIHDILLTVGVYAVTGFQVVPATVIAFLTILGFSLYDTVVVFDKVRREHADGRHRPGRHLLKMVNRSLNQVLMRSLNTSFVAVLPVASLVFVGSGLFGATALQGLRRRPLRRPRHRGVLVDLRRDPDPRLAEGARTPLPGGPRAGACSRPRRQPRRARARPGRRTATPEPVGAPPARRPGERTRADAPRAVRPASGPHRRPTGGPRPRPGARAAGAAPPRQQRRRKRR